MEKKKVEERVKIRMKEIDYEIMALLDERGLLEAIRQANWFSEPIRTEALKVLIDQYKKLYG